MSSDPTRRLIDALANDLEAVRRIPPLRVGVATVLVAGLAVACVLTLRVGLRPELGAALANGVFASVLAGLVLVALGGSVAALAASVPGRGRETALGAAAALFGIVCAAVGGALALALAGGLATEPVPLAGHLACIARALLLGLVPLAAAALYASRAAPHDLRPLAVFAAAGSVALGALAVHVTCPAGAGLHLIAGHALAPAAGVAALAPIVWLALRALRRF